MHSTPHQHIPESDVNRSVHGLHAVRSPESDLLCPRCLLHRLSTLHQHSRESDISNSLYGMHFARSPESDLFSPRCLSHTHSTLHQHSRKSEVNRLPLSTHIMGSSEVVVKCGNSCAILCTWGSRFLDTPGTTRKNPEQPGRTQKNREKPRLGFFWVLPGSSGYFRATKDPPKRTP